MKSVGVAQMKAALSRYLSRVKRGDEVVVTEHGKPIAKLIPYGPKGTRAKERLLLAREGIAELGNGRIHPSLLQSSPVADSEGHLLQAILSEREETR